jgi:DNA-binding NarL/FixJ family response regulator
MNPEIGVGGIQEHLSPSELQTASLFAEGLSQKAVADRLGVPQQSVSVRLRRIRKRLGPPGAVRRVF